MRFIVFACAAVFAVAAGCGGKSEEEEKAEKRAELRAKAERDAAERRAKARRLYRKCDAAMGDFLVELKELNSRLDVGLSYDEYTEKVADVKVAYDDADFTNMGEIKCLRIAAAGEKALNQYLKA